MKCLVVLALVAACFAETPSKKGSSLETKDKRGISGYDTSYSGGHLSSYSSGGHGAAVALPTSNVGFGSYGGIGHSPIFLSAPSLGLLGHSYGLSAPVALGNHGLTLAQPILLSSGHGYGGHGYSGSSFGLGGLGSVGFGIPTSHVKFGPIIFGQGTDSATAPETITADHGSSSLSVPSKTYGTSFSSSSSYQPSSSHSSSYSAPGYTTSYSAPSYSSSSSSYSAPSYSSSSSYSLPSSSSYSSSSSSYSSPSYSYSAPSSSYGHPSSSYSAPSSSYGPPSSSYGVPSSSDFGSSFSYSSGGHSSKDYRSH